MTLGLTAPELHIAARQAVTLAMSAATDELRLHFIQMAELLLAEAAATEAARTFPPQRSVLKGVTHGRE